MTNLSRYEQRGVSATKDEVHAAIKGMDKGLYPNAFCKILPDFAAGDPDWCNLMHADTAGTKTSLAYLYWRETGDLSVWEGIAQDALVMNLDDMACVGCYDNIILSSTIGRNKNRIPAEVISTIIRFAESFRDRMASLGVQLQLAGGETADVGDIVRTLDVGYTAFARMPRAAVLENQLQEGDVVVALASYGQASYETSYNGGMGSNGLTGARHDVLSKQYARLYPESFNPDLADEVVYTGSRSLTESVTIGEQTMPLGKLLLSPTRTYLPVIKQIFEELRPHLHGMIHCTGGGQTKVSKFCGELTVVKDQWLPMPPLFELIQAESQTDWREMYQVFNMGQRLEVYLPPAHAQAVVDIANAFGIDAAVVGRVTAFSGEKVRLETPQGTFSYS